jgi:oligo-1,6-glucosidase
MQWSGDSNAGFTRGTPWIRVNPNHRTLNVAAAERDSASVLHYFRRMIRLRKSEPTLVYGRYRLLDRENPEVFAYTRTLDDRTVLVALSFSPGGGRMTVPSGYTTGRTLISNLGESPIRGRQLLLQPYQAVVLELNPED